jgi:radical SAM-linked protein
LIPTWDDCGVILAAVSAAPRSQPEQHAPPVQRLRVRYAKRGRARFASHRDFGRAFERALRRAAVPMAYTSGFSPHQRISYANAAPTGAASEAEYLEIALAEPCDPEKVRVALDAALPSGMDVVQVVEARGGALADRLTGSVWTVDWPTADAIALRTAVEALLARDSVVVGRMTKNGLRSFDVRGALVGLRVTPGPTVRMVLRHDTPLVRPDDVLRARTEIDAAVGIPTDAVVTRRAQGPLDAETGDVGDPFV